MERWRENEIRVQVRVATNWGYSANGHLEKKKRVRIVFEYFRVRCTQLRAKYQFYTTIALAYYTYFVRGEFIGCVLCTAIHLGLHSTLWIMYKRWLGISQASHSGLVKPSEECMKWLASIQSVLSYWGWNVPFLLNRRSDMEMGRERRGIKNGLWEREGRMEGAVAERERAMIEWYLHVGKELEQDWAGSRWLDSGEKIHTCTLLHCSMPGTHSHTPSLTPTETHQ